MRGGRFADGCGKRKPSRVGDLGLYSPLEQDIRLGGFVRDRSASGIEEQAKCFFRIVDRLRCEFAKLCGNFQPSFHNAFCQSIDMNLSRRFAHLFLELVPVGLDMIIRGTAAAKMTLPPFIQDQ